MTDLELVRQEGLKVDNLLCFALYAASRAAVDVYRPFLDKLEITYPQYLVMLLLWEEAPRTIKELGNVLYLDSGTLSPLLKRLEKRGLIKRQRDIQDERLVNISLTAEGRALKEQARDLPETLFCQVGLPVEDFGSLIERLHSLTERLKTVQEAAKKP
jgi:MarR family transcriptional regulator, organic hydroperoxide resistance regulator